MIGPAASALLAETRRRPGRLFLTGLAILVATIFAAGTLLLSDSLRGFVGASTQETPGGAAAVVRTDLLPTPPVDPARLVATVAAAPGAAGAVGFWTAALPVSGAGPTTEWEVSSDPMTGPLTRLTAPPVTGTLPTEPDQVVVGKATAGRAGLAPGSMLTVASSTGTPRTVVVTAVVDVAIDGVNTFLGFPATIAALGAGLEQIDVAPAPGIDDTTLVERIGSAIHAPAAVRTASDQRVTEAQQASSAATAVLVGVGAFAGLAVVAAAVVVASTFRIVLAQRRTQLALLRCVGARRRQVIGAVLAEAVVSGLVAGVIGVAVAVLGGYGLVGGAHALGIDAVPALVVSWPGMAGCLLGAVLATVLAALAPALAASRIPPVAALSAAAAGESGSPPPGRRLLAAGAPAAVAIAGAVAALGIGRGPDTMVVATITLAASGMTAFAALVAAGPVLVRALAATLGRAVAAVGRGPGRLAVANATQVPRRTAATIAVLALGVGLTSALLVALASAEAASERSVAALFPGDIAISATDLPGMAQRLAADPALVVVTTDSQSVYVDPAAGVDGAAARHAVETAVTGRPGVIVQYAADVRSEVETAILTMRLIGLALVGMTMLVAVVGVAVTLMLSVTERTRETGLLRAVGLSRPGVRAMVAWEAALSGLGAAAVGAVLGAGYGVMGTRVLGVGDGFDVAALPSLGGLVLGVVLLAVLAAAVPAARAGRVPPIRALQD